MVLEVAFSVDRFKVFLLILNFKYFNFFFFLFIYLKMEIERFFNETKL